jgi:cytochrome c oxidase cbb3-type subunit IV
MQDVYGVISGILTALLIVLFSGIAVWAWSGARRKAFDAAARLPLEEDADTRRHLQRERAP